MRLLAAAWLALVLAADCGGSAGDAKAPLCAHPASLDVSGPGACTLGRAAFSCKAPGLGLCECVTSEAKCGCGNPCENQCQPNEYAAECGGPAVIQGVPAPTYVAPPADCRRLIDYPSGASVYCCPCQ